MEFNVKEIYCAGHFGNWYECAWPNEYKEFLKEMKFWGFNWYSDWFVTTDSGNPENYYCASTLSQTLFERKRINYKNAYQLNFNLDLLICPNHVFLDQLKEEYLAKTGKKETGQFIFGQLICPSNKKAREVILKNMEFIFKYLCEEKIYLKALTGIAYDYGGCLCEKCKPWILTWANLMREIYEIGKKYHPDIKLRFLTWWWSEDEYELMEEYVKKNEGLVDAFVFHIGYDKTIYHAKKIPLGIKKLAFIHIGYGDKEIQDGDIDVYGIFGPVIAPERLEETLKNLKEGRADGFVLYSEGCFDDINKAIVGAISSGMAKNSIEAIEMYIKKYFTEDEKYIERWKNYLLLWSKDKGSVDLDKAEKEFEILKENSKRNWRVDMWEARLKIEKVNRKIKIIDGWNKEKFELVEKFFEEIEHLYRDVYRVGPVRHILKVHPGAPFWYGDYLKGKFEIHKEA